MLTSTGLAFVHVLETTRMRLLLPQLRTFDDLFLPRSPSYDAALCQDSHIGNTDVPP